MARKSSVPERLLRQVQERAQGRCEYCLIHESDMYYPHEADHVIAEKHGGATSLENLAWACFYCNRFKGSDLVSVDPTSQKAVFLFNPREQSWKRHFRLNGGRIEDLTASDRAAVALLHLNDAERVVYRLGLVDIGHYPAR
jgi:hypothetical protein